MHVNCYSCIKDEDLKGSKGFPNTKNVLVLIETPNYFCFLVQTCSKPYKHHKSGKCLVFISRSVIVY